MENTTDIKNNNETPELTDEDIEAAKEWAEEMVKKGVLTKAWESDSNETPQTPNVPSEN